MTRSGSSLPLALALPLALLAALAAPAAAVEDPDATTPEACASTAVIPASAPGESAVGLAGSSPAPSALPASSGTNVTNGRWRRMARAPFGSEYEPVAWTGRRLVAVDGDSGRTAVYAPARDRWREVATAPRRFDTNRRWAWTGRELVILQSSDDGSAISGAAYRTATDRWRRISPLRVEPDGRADHTLAEPVWTGTHVVVADSLGLLAAYDPAADCWIELGAVPGEPWVWGLYVAGPSLLVESRRWDEPVEIRALDPATMTWSEPLAGPLDREASEDGAHWADGRLVYLTWYARDDAIAGSNATFDPVTMTWAAFEHDCLTPASGTIVAGELLVASDGRRAIDPLALACQELPRPPRPLNGTERTVWTGSELLAWSGLREGPAPPRRGGLRFTPADDAGG